MNTDNPGFGVSGTISASGTFLLSGAGWYPRVADARQSLMLTVEGPDDTVAVTAGRLLGIDHQGARTVSRWQIDNHLEGLSLSAGPYGVEKRMLDGLSAATYFFPDNKILAPRYLEASLRHLKRYSDLFGAYPFDGFAVVENFFPTGYGFPGYSLMGGRVLRLPFIPETSLPHEIVHSWWGNGVLVDVASGNWCEGLTSYTADYLIKEQASSHAAMDYRRQALRNCATLVSPATDFPLSRFRSRTDPATKAVGYDKSTMVFHMLRKEVGEDAFWASLRHFYGQFRFKHASWKDLQAHFEKQTGRSLDSFIGLPDRPEALRLFPRDLALAPKAFDAGGQHFDGSGDVLFAVARHPEHPGKNVALLHPLSTEAADQAALKIPHYGRYSYLAFSDGPNRIKGTWEVTDSPVMVRWEPRPTQ